MAYEKTAIPDEFWKAIRDCDKAYDDTFLYGVKTTGIFCKPSCKSRLPNIENVTIFRNANMALKENFRPCKRCKPDGLILPVEEWIKQMTEWIDRHYSQPISLHSLGEIFHGSPFHLQRQFKKVTGISPAEYIQKVRLERAVQMLETTEQTIAEIGLSAGFASTPYFISLFKKKLGTTPAAYRKNYLRSGGIDHET